MIPRPDIPLPTNPAALLAVTPRYHESITWFELLRKLRTTGVIGHPEAVLPKAAALARHIVTWPLVSWRHPRLVFKTKEAAAMLGPAIEEARHVARELGIDAIEPVDTEHALHRDLVTLAYQGGPAVEEETVETADANVAPTQSTGVVGIAAITRSATATAVVDEPAVGVPPVAAPVASHPATHLHGSGSTSVAQVARELARNWKGASTMLAVALLIVRETGAYKLEGVSTIDEFAANALGLAADQVKYLLQAGRAIREFYPAEYAALETAITSGTASPLEPALPSIHVLRRLPRVLKAAPTADHPKVLEDARNGKLSVRAAATRASARAPTNDSPSRPVVAPNKPMSPTDSVERVFQLADELDALVASFEEASEELRNKLGARVYDILEKLVAVQDALAKKGSD